MTDLTFALSGRQDIYMNEGIFDAKVYADTVISAERLGFDHVLVPDHVFVPEYWAKVISDLWLDPFALLSYLAAVTSKIELVIACLVVPYRQPFTVAKSVATIDQLSGGRMALGVVPGYLKEEYDAFGLPLEGRGETTNEFVRIMIELWTNNSAGYSGEHYRFDGVNMTPKCVRSPHAPIWVGGSSKGAVQRVAEFGDVWNPLGFTVINDSYRAANEHDLAGKPLPTSGTTPDRLAEGLAYARELADAAGRDLSQLQVVTNATVGPTDGRDDQSLRERSAATRSVSAQTVDWLGQYIDAGATGFVVTPRGDTPQECVDYLEQFAADIVPQLPSTTS